MTDTKIWLVIEKNTYGQNNHSYSITKTANTVEQATTFKVHLDALNDKENRTYFIASDISTIIDKVVYHHNKSVDEKPLILKDEVKETSAEMPF
jgi:type IV secretory pathway VirJ component